MLPTTAPQKSNIPDAKTVDLREFHFSDFPLSEFELIKCGIRCFFELGVVEKFKVQAEVRGSTSWFVRKCVPPSYLLPGRR